MTFNPNRQNQSTFQGVDNVPFSSVEQTWVDKVAKVKTEGRGVSTFLKNLWLLMRTKTTR